MNHGVREILNHLSPGRHLLTLHNGDDNRIGLMATFFSQGLSKGERCVFFGGERLGEESLRRLNDRVPGLGDHLLRGSVVLVPERLAGEPADATAAIREVAGQALRDGYTGLRLVAEMTWLLDILTDPMDFLPLLEDLDGGLASARVTLLSQFREDTFPPELIFNVLRKHPVIVIGDGVFENSFPNTPDEPEGRPFRYRGASKSVPEGDPGIRQRWVLAEGLAALLEALPSPLLLNYDHQCTVNSHLDSLLTDSSLAGRDIIKELSGLSPGTKQTLQYTLSDGRTFSFRCLAPLHDPDLRLAVGRETAPARNREPGSFGYARLLDDLPLGFLEIDREGRIASANARAASLLACRREEIPGRRYLDMVHPLDRSRAALWLAKNGQGPAALEMRVTSPRGECWVSAQATPSPRADLTGIIWEDINDRKKSEVLQLLSQELVTLQDRLQFLSTRDALTGLFNRQYFEEEIRRLQNPRFAPVSILIVDVDGLKPINDNFGHPRGDELLQTAAQVLRKPFRETDMVARIGGDEFAVVLPQTPYELAQGRREEILKEVQCHNAGSEGPPLSLSVGVATADQDGASLEDTIKRADDDMYRFKLASSVCLPMARKDIMARRRISAPGRLPAGRLIALGGIQERPGDTPTDDHDDRDAPLLS